MILQLITLTFQRFFYLNESGIKGVGFNGKLLRWGYVEVSLQILEIYTLKYLILSIYVTSKKDFSIHFYRFFCNIDKNIIQKMKITYLLFLSLTTLFFVGCSKSTKTEIKYYHSDRSSGKDEDDKSDWIKSVYQYKWMEEGELGNLTYDKWEEHGWCKTYYIPELYSDVDGPNHLKDSTLYDRGEIKEQYIFYSNGNLKDFFKQEVVECKDPNTIHPNSPSLKTIRILSEGYHENGQMESRWTYKLDNPNKNPLYGEVFGVNVYTIGWYENGQKRFEHTYRENGKELTKDQWDENGKWNGEYYTESGKIIRKKSYDQKFN